MHGKGGNEDGNGKRDFRMSHGFPLWIKGRGFSYVEDRLPLWSDITTNQAVPSARQRRLRPLEPYTSFTPGVSGPFTQARIVRQAGNLSQEEPHFLDGPTWGA